jgi:hypothetical protein
MRTLTIAFIVAAGMAIAAPAIADDVSVGVGGVGVGVHERDGAGVRVREDHDRVIHRERREHVTVGMGEARHCKVVIVHREGLTKKIKRCD